MHCHSGRHVTCSLRHSTCSSCAAMMRNTWQSHVLVARSPEQIESESWNVITPCVFPTSRHEPPCRSILYRVTSRRAWSPAIRQLCLRMTDSADASCRVTSTGNTSLLTYHVRSRLKSSIINHIPYSNARRLVKLATSWKFSVSGEKTDRA